MRFEFKRARDDEGGHHRIASVLVIVKYYQH
jgi:hypothetical protein